MSPVSTAIREGNGTRPAPVPPFPLPDLFHQLAMEIVVDWQMSTESDRTR
jgi:hypothetical protein